MIIDVDILQKHIEKAKGYSTKSLNHTYDRFKLTDEERTEKISIGKVGEEIIKDLFDKENVSYKEDTTSPEELDKFDLICGDKQIDVKTCSKDFHKLLLVVKKKFDTYKKHDYYIGVKLSEDMKKAKIYGYSTKEDISGAKVENKGYKDNYSIPLEDLRQIEELLKLLKSISKTKNL